MFGEKLIQAIESLPKKELRQFQAFVESPYFNKHQGVIKLVEFLNEIAPDFSPQTFNWNIIIQRIFGGDALKAKKQFGPYTTYTLNLLRTFITQQELKDQEPTQSILLLKGLRRRNLNQPFEKELKKGKTPGLEVATNDTISYKYSYQLADEANTFYNKIGKRKKDDSIKVKHHYLDRYFLLEKLRDSCDMLIRTKILNFEFEDEFLPFILSFIKNNLVAFQEDLQILIYYKIYLMHQTFETSYYFEALAILEKKPMSLPIEELKTIYVYLQNFCIEQINKGNSSFLSEIFKLYQSQLNQDLLIEDGYLSQWHYKNIVTTGLRLEETDWVKAFIENFKNRLPKKDQENAYKFNLASYYYTTKQYEKVLNLLLSIEYSDYRYNLGSKALLLRTYFDLEEYAPLFALTDSFRHYLLRNKLMANNMRVGYHNLFKLTRRVAHLKANHEVMPHRKVEKELSKLKTTIQQTERIFNKSWLIQKVNDLESLV